MQVTTRMIIASLCAGLAIACDSPSQSVRRYSHPGGKFALELRGAEDWPTEPWRSRTVYVTSFVAGRKGPEVPVYEGDGFDAEFRGRFGEPRWLAEHVVRFPSARMPTDDWSLTIENKAATSVAAIVVRAADLYIVTELGVNAKVQVPLSKSESEFISLAAEVFDSRGRKTAEGYLRETRRADSRTFSFVAVLDDSATVALTIR